MSRPPFDPHLEQWIAQLRKEGKAARTSTVYKSDLAQAAITSTIDCRSSRALRVFDQSTINHLWERWTADGTKPATRLRRLSALRTFARFLCGKGIDCNRLLSAQPPSVRRFPRDPADRRLQGYGAVLPPDCRESSRSKRPTLSMDEVRLVTRPPLPTDDWTAARDAAAFSIQAGSGLTPSETVALNLRDLRSASIEVRSEAFRPRIVELKETSSAMIRRYLDAVPFQLSGAGPLFVNRRARRLSERTLQLSFRRRRMECGLAGPCGPSSLRKNHATFLVAGGCFPEKLAETLGLHPNSVFRFFGGGQP
jgi:site-specific recombinase XerC